MVIRRSPDWTKARRFIRCFVALKLGIRFSNIYVDHESIWKRTRNLEIIQYTIVFHWLRILPTFNRISQSFTTSWVFNPKLVAYFTVSISLYITPIRPKSEGIKRKRRKAKRRVAGKYISWLHLPNKFNKINKIWLLRDHFNRQILR